MYEERKESFSVRSLILQILFVVLTVFLLLWLFPTKNYVKDYANDAFTEKLQPLYNQIYNQNITTMKEAAINYFTTDRLPSKVGESVTITLKEMQDKKLVLDLIDSNNKKCDVEKSSVKVEKLTRSQQVEKKKQAILAAAFDDFVAYGYAGARMELIAKKSRCCERHSLSPLH